MATPSGVRPSSPRNNARMRQEIIDYLEDVRHHLHLDQPTEQRVMEELYTYFQEKISELTEEGMSERTATRASVRSFGRAKNVAVLLYEAHSKGSWQEALLAAFPHLVTSFMFAFHLWRHPVLSPLVFLSFVCVTLYGWWRGKPNWFYPWLGYSFLPMLLGCYALWPVLYQGYAGHVLGAAVGPPVGYLVASGLFYVGSFVVILATTVRVVRRDWILASLMIVHLPIVGFWIFNLESIGGLFAGSSPFVFYWDQSLMLVFSVLAAASAFFIRLRARLGKIVALLAIGTLTGAFVVQNIWGALGFFGLLGVSVALLLFLLSPALVEMGLGKDESWSRRVWAFLPRSERPIGRSRN